MTHLKI